MAAVRLSLTPRARRSCPSSRGNDPTRFESRRGSFAPAFLVTCLASFLIASCSEKPAPANPQPDAEKSEAEKKDAAKEKAEKEETEERPHEDEIAEDCVAFVRATKILPKTAAADCPGCSAEGTEILAFRQMRIDRISCSADTCEIAVTLRAVFNPAPAGTITGGLAGWISQEQRLHYLEGHPPEGEQVYRVKITYRRTGEGWRAIEFDRADSQ
jgi:hypothetical protein